MVNRAVDSSSFIAFWLDENKNDVKEVTWAMEEEALLFPPPVIAELKSFPRLMPNQKKYLESAPLLPLSEGFWLRAGELRSNILRQGKKANLADALIAQSCIDHNVPLITRDNDFRHYEEFGLYILV